MSGKNPCDRSEDRVASFIDSTETARRLYDDLSPQDWRAATRTSDRGQQRGQERAQERGQERGQEQLLNVLSDANAGPQEKLKAIESLGKSGITRLTLPDSNGGSRDVRIELEKSGSKTLVHLYANDDTGKERILLRGVSNGDGTFSNEKDAKGRDVSFQGAWWTGHMQGRSMWAAPGKNNVDDYYNARTEDLECRLRDLYSYEVGPERSQVLRDPVTRPDIATEQQMLNDMFDEVSRSAGGARRMTSLPGDAVYFRAGMTIDADGSPRAKQIDPTGQTRTSLRYKDGSSVNAEHIPYVVLPLGKYKHLGVNLGDIAAVRYNGKVQFAVFADAGPSYKLGEGSMALAQALGINNSPRHGGVSKPVVEYIVFPGSGNGRPGTTDMHQVVGTQRLYQAASTLNDLNIRRRS